VEILIWGDNMKRQMSISIFLAILVIALAWLYIKYRNDIRPDNMQTKQIQQESEENSISISQEYTAYKYYIKAEDGRLIVYESKSQNIYMETSIEIDTLPLDIKEKLDVGIFFETEGDLYDFLESYSS